MILKKFYVEINLFNILRYNCFDINNSSWKILQYSIFQMIYLSKPIERPFYALIKQNMRN